VAQPVVIDITRLLGRYFDQRHPTGVDRVSLAYLQHYAPVARTMVRWHGRSGLFSEVISRQVVDVLQRWDSADTASLRALIWRGFVSAIGTGNARGAVFLHTGHNDVELASLWRNISWHKVRPVFFVHDLIPLTHPQFCRAGEPERHRQRVSRMLRGAAIVANSKHTLTELANFAQTNGVDMPRSCVALLAPAQQYASKLIANSATAAWAKKPKLSKKPYFLIVGTIEPRKNHAMLLDVWRHLLSTLPVERVPDLVVIGQTGWNCAAIEQQLRDTAQFKGCVKWIAQCDDAEMAQWMHGACALLFPSYVEGFGMPAVEALLAGTPVIASDLAVFRESVAQVPAYLPIDDVPAWTEQITRYAQADSPQRSAQLQRLQGWQAPTWDAHFAQVDALLASIPALK
jgi:glycosyltransferase involved in cell wall biosynthesis